LRGITGDLELSQLSKYMERKGKRFEAMEI
jgi:hypothetical protein